MALVSPGLQLTVTDESQYVSAAVGTVPLVFLATAQNKTLNGSLATGTSAANAGQLQIFGSQRELASALGYPGFKTTAAGTPIHGDERNEYGLMAAYSALGLGNRVYGVRADIDLAQLTGTSVRPSGQVTDGTYWFDLADTSWGIYEWNASTQSFVENTPIMITSSSNTTPVSYDSLLISEPTPLTSIGQIGSYAVVATTTSNRIFYKRYDNTWVPIGSTGWQAAWPAVTGTATNPTLTTNIGQTIVINSVIVTLTVSGTIAKIAADINTAAITGVTARVVSGRLAIYATSLAKSNGTTVDGRLTIAAGASGTLLATVGLSAGSFNSLGTSSSGVVYGSYAKVPQWDTNGTVPAPSGAVWLKTGTLGGGSNFVFKQYNALTGTWSTQGVVAHTDSADAIYSLDPAAGGSNIGVGTVYMYQDPNPLGTATLQMGAYRPFVRTVYGQVKSTAVSAPSGPFTLNDTFTIKASQPGTASYSSSYTVTLSGTTANDFVTAVLLANIPNVTAGIESNGAISMTHLTGGTMVLTPVTGIPLTTAGFVAGASNLVMYGTSARAISGFAPLTYTYSITEPYANPVDGAMWYYNDATSVDIMINDGTKWRGYHSLSADARGYALSNGSPAGVLVMASTPTAQSDNTALVAGDIWLDTSDLENYPKLSRFNGTTWIAIDNTDQISQNGIVFADARWDSSGTTDPVAGTIPSITALQTSDYVDLDAPDARLYPRGMLLFNTRRSGYNVKRWVSDYFSFTSYQGVVSVYDNSVAYAVGARVEYGSTVYVATAATTAHLPTVSTYWSPLIAGAWVSSSGNKSNGAMYAGHKAQRAMIVEAMKAAIDGNTQIREDQFQFNLIVAPGYPEVISNMVSLNNDRANTAFIIGDTPMSLSTNVVGLTNWSNGAVEGGLTTADPYLAVYYPSGLSNDVQGNTIMVPPSHMALRTFIHNDNLAYQWFAPAGTRRGLVDNATDLGYLDTASGEFQRTGVSQSLRDSLYTINVNPITIITGTGIVVWGQKTRNPVASAMDRINVARLVNYIRTILAKTGNGFLFEPNDKITRDQIKAIIESALNDLVAKRGIYDYLVVCDTSNNTSDRIARNEMYVDIAIEPMKDVEFIYIPIRLLNPGTISGLGK